MSGHFGRKWIAKTRKSHSCGWCAKRIEAGSAAESSSGVFEGDFWAHYVHPECAAARDSMTYRELEEGWFAGDFARGRADDETALPPVFSPSYRGKLAAQRDQTEESASSKPYGYNCAVCGEPIVGNQLTAHTDDGLSHEICTIEIPAEL